MSIAVTRSRFLTGISANVLGGAGSTIFNLLVPALLVKHLGKLEFSLWSLALQVLVYLQICGFGLQTAITKFIAQGNELNDIVDQRKTVKAGLVLIAGSTLLAVGLVALLAACYPLLFEDIPPSMVGEFRICIAFLGLSAAGQLLAQVPAGIFIGLHRNFIPVLGLLTTRIIGLCVLAIMLENGAGLVTTVIMFSICAGLVVPLNYYALLRLRGGIFRTLAALNLDRLIELLRYCGGLTIWSVCMLFVSGLDMVLVGHYDFGKVAAYSLCATAVTIFLGVMQAFMSPLLAIGSALFANPARHVELPQLLIKSSQFCAGFLVMTVFAYFLIGRYALSLWIDTQYINDVRRILSVLLVSVSIRNLMVPYSILLVAVGRHSGAFLPAIAEGAVNLIASLLLVREYGAIGVAFATVLGAIAGVLMSLFFVVDKVRVLFYSRTIFFKKIILLPACGLLSISLLGYFA